MKKIRKILIKYDWVYLLMSEDSLRVQYRECLENYRSYDKFVWQIPQLTTLIITAVIGVAFGYLDDDSIAQIAVLIFGVLLTITMYVVMKKLRYFQYWHIHRLREIEKILTLNPMPIVTGRDGTEVGSWIERRSGQKWMANLLLIMALILIILVFYVIFF